MTTFVGLGCFGALRSCSFVGRRVQSCFRSARGGTDDFDFEFDFDLKIDLHFEFKFDFDFEFKFDFDFGSAVSEGAKLAATFRC